METTRKKVMAILAAGMFAVMMMLSVNTSVNGTNFSATGMCVLANGNTGNCSGTGSTCFEGFKPCSWPYADCNQRVVCEPNCSCPTSHSWGDPEEWTLQGTCNPE